MHGGVRGNPARGAPTRSGIKQAKGGSRLPFADHADGICGAVVEQVLLGGCNKEVVGGRGQGPQIRHLHVLGGVQSGLSGAVAGAHHLDLFG